jgi:hypothetical protein
MKIADGDEATPNRREYQLEPHLMALTRSAPSLAHGTRRHAVYDIDRDQRGTQLLPTGP